MFSFTPVSSAIVSVVLCSQWGVEAAFSGGSLFCVLDVWGARTSGHIYIWYINQKNGRRISKLRLNWAPIEDTHPAHLPINETEKFWMFVLNPQYFVAPKSWRQVFYCMIFIEGWMKQLGVVTNFWHRGPEAGGANVISWLSGTIPAWAEFTRVTIKLTTLRCQNFMCLSDCCKLKIRSKLLLAYCSHDYAVQPLQTYPRKSCSELLHKTHGGRSSG